VPVTPLINLLLKWISPLVTMVAGGVSFGGRRQRVQYPGAMYHVIQRGDNREYIFNEPEDRDLWLIR
jgi:hypothetical protein